MTAAPTAAPRARPQATDLDKAGLGQRFPLVAPARNPIALHLVQAWEAYEMTHPTDRVERLLRAGRSATGIGPEVHSGWLAPDGHLDIALPRGVPWERYPVVGEPRYRFRHADALPARTARFAPGMEHALNCPISDLPSRVTSVIVHLATGWDGTDAGGQADWLAQALAVVGMLSEDVPIHLVDPEGNVVGDLATLVALLRGSDPWRRFLYSYAANFSAIAYKALEAATAHWDDGSHELRRAAWPDTPRDPRGLREQVRETIATRAGSRTKRNGLLHPLALQVLYALRRQGGAPLRAPVRGTDSQAWQRDLVTPGWDLSPVWRGTGRYAPAPVDPATVESVARALVVNGLLRLDGQAIVPSAAGEAFLDALHPDCEDPDMPCRWASRPMGEPERAAMDAWITRTFRKMKRAVNALPSDQRTA
jgi:hypothetical protein